MLRANVGLSRKLSKDYNSTGYSVNLEGEITAPVSDPSMVIEQIKELFDLAEEALGQQIERSEAELALGARDAVRLVGPSATDGAKKNAGTTSNAEARTDRSLAPPRNDDSATSKQISYLLTLAKRLQLTTSQLESRIAEVLDRPIGLYELSKKSAALVIDALANSRDSVGASTR